MKNHLSNYSLLIISISSPILVGVYKDNLLIDSLSSYEKTSDILLNLLTPLLAKYDIEKMIYTKGPGSYMAIKLTYIILKTIEVTRGIACLGCSGFELNHHQPIKAIGNLYFIKEKETIITKKFEKPVKTTFCLPSSIEHLPMDENAMPEYVLPAV